MFLLWGKYIRKYYLRYLVFFVVGIAALITVDWFQLELPEIIGSIVNKMKNDGGIDLTSNYFKSTMIHITYVAFILFGGRVIWRLSLFFASKKIEAHIRKEMFLKAEQLDVTYYQQNKIGNIMSWATNDLDTLQEFLGWGSLMLVDGVFLTIFAVSKMFVLNSSLALISFVPIVLIAILGALCSKFMSESWRLRQESNDALYDFSQESFTGIRVIKAFVKEIKQINEFSKIARQNSNYNVKFTFVSTLYSVLIEIIIALIAAVILAFGGWFVYLTVSGEKFYVFNKLVTLEAGDLITFFGYFFSLIWPMIAIGQVITNFSKARTSYRRIAIFLDAPIIIKDKDGAVDIDISGNIDFKHLSFNYPNSEKSILNDISFEIKQGEIVGIVGTVGSGKTTLINMLLHLYNINPHQLYIDGVDITDIKIDCLRKGIALAPQDNFLFSGSIIDNVSFADELPNDEKAMKSLFYSDMQKDLNEFEHGANTLINEGAKTISGGQKQRVALARAIYKDSPILVLDDIVSAVDVSTEDTILKNIRKIRDKKTTIIVASRISTVMNADKVVVLNKGKLEAFASPKELLNISETFKTMYMLQKLSSKKGVKNA